jgi:hypothetical protein
MDQMVGRDPMAIRRFTQIAMLNLDIVLRAFHARRSTPLCTSSPRRDG